MTNIIEANALGKRYGRRWALQDCSIVIPEGKVVGLIGPNGAGKSTLLNLAVGLLAPTTGSIHVAGEAPGSSATRLNRVGFVAQDTPLYARMSIADHLLIGNYLNPQWDDDVAMRQLEHLNIDKHQRAGSLSGGQRAQVALALATAKRPDLLVLDEPVASLDPLARREFLQTLMTMFAERPLSVVLSSHLVEDLERVCDYVVVLVRSRVQLAGDVADVLSTHYRISGPRREKSTLPANQEIIEETHAEKQSTFLIRTNDPIYDPNWVVTPVTLEDIALAYMRRNAASAARATVLEVAR